MKSMAVIVTPPVFKASGGVAAGLSLSRAISKIEPYTAAIMAETTEDEGTSSNGLLLKRFECSNFLGSLADVAPRALKTVFWRCSKMEQFIVETRPSVVHFHNPHPPLALLHLTQVCQRNNIPYVMSSHGFVELATPENWLTLGALQKAAYKNLVQKPFLKAVAGASAICLLSPFESTVADSLDISEERRFCITNGHDPFFRQAADQQVIRQVRERFGLAKQGTTFLFIGNHTVNKGIDTLLTACHRSKGNWRVVIGGGIRSVTEHEELRSKYNVEALGDRVVFTDFVSREELRALYQSVDGFVFPSKADTLPLVILDAMASELPVVSTTVGGIPFQVDDETGRLVDPDDPVALAAALDEVADSKVLRQRLGAAGLERVLHRFDWDSSARLALEVYDQVIDSRVPVAKIQTK